MRLMTTSVVVVYFHPLKALFGNTHIHLIPFFLDYTVTSDTHDVRILTHMNTRT